MILEREDNGIGACFETVVSDGLNHRPKTDLGRHGAPVINDGLPVATSVPHVKLHAPAPRKQVVDVPIQHPTQIKVTIGSKQQMESTLAHV